MSRVDGWLLAWLVPAVFSGEAFCSQRTCRAVCIRGGNGPGGMQ